MQNSKVEQIMHKSQCQNTSRNVLSGPQPTSLKLLHNSVLTRQRQPAKFISDIPTHVSTNSSFNLTSEHKSNVQKASTLRRNSLNTMANYSIHSEFDTTQINSYLNHNKKSFGSKSSTKCNTLNRIRSRSVESPGQRLRILCKPSNKNIEIIVSDCLLNKLTNSKNLNSSIDDKIDKFSDTLNSEGSSISGESATGEYNNGSAEESDCVKVPNKTSSKKSTKPVPIVKSVLKKSSSYFEDSHRQSEQRSYFIFGNSFLKERFKFGTSAKQTNPNMRQFSSYKKNVTFSAYATIQMMDN